MAQCPSETLNEPISDTESENDSSESESPLAPTETPNDPIDSTEPINEPIEVPAAPTESQNDPIDSSESHIDPIYSTVKKSSLKTAPHPAFEHLEEFFGTP